MSRFGGFPEKFKKEGVYGSGRSRLLPGDIVKADRSPPGTEIIKGEIYEIEDTVVEHNPQRRGFEGFIKIRGMEGLFIAKKFRFVSGGFRGEPTT